MSLEEDSNVMLGDLQRYLKPNKRGLLWKPKEQTKEVERGIWNENYLKKLHATLKQFRLKKCTKRNLPKCLFYDETPTTESPQTMLGSDDRDEKIYQNILQTQKTVKGRAIQSMLQKGVKKFRDAIEEAKETHSISAVRKLFPKEFSQQIDNQNQIMKEYKRIEEVLKNDDKLQEELKKVESKDAGNLLNFLEKELLRLQGEKRAHALFLLTERERYGREAAALTENDEIERQFQNDAITLYLENILIEGINRASDDTSREYIRKFTRKIDKKASRNVTFDENIENFSNDSNTESIPDETEIPDPKIVVELLKDQVFPNLFDRVKNEQMKLKQKKFLQNAHQDLYREEFLQLQREQEYKICSDIIGEIIENAVTSENEFVNATIIKKRQHSAEAEMLASHLIEQILNEIINSNFETSSSTSDSNSTSRDYDGDDSNSNIQSITETETESSADVLARQVVQNVLADIMEHGVEVSSTSEYTETSDS